MLIPFGQLVKKYGLKVRGVLHVGAHQCEEQSAYDAEGVEQTIWLEANEKLVASERVRGRNIYHILASDKDDEEVDFNLSNNGQSSSMLEFGVHKHYHPSVHFTDKVRMKTKRIDTLAHEQKWDMRAYNFLNVDVQGADLMAIKGMDTLLSNFDAVYVEVNTDEVYLGCAQLPEMDAYLLQHGFIRKELAMTDAKWGDAFYLKSQNTLLKEERKEEKGSMLFDVGAHRGLYADTHIHQFDRLILVEPNAELATFLRDKYKNNPKVKIVEAIVSDEKQAMFYLCNVDTISTAAKVWVEQSRFSDKGFEWTPQTNIPTRTLDSIIAEYGVPTKTKIDVEGYESHVIRSLHRHVGPLSFEWAEEVREDIVRCLYHLTKLGYTKFYIQNGDQYDFTPREADYASIDQIIQQLNLWKPQRRDLWGMIHCL